ncbi:hypothetical protein EYE40_09505 [Glaciihabitans arcticus]|uniref:Ig-like domain repeat protein n=1 Tax=Glaciihabitans arcticus TaxID=2668039 RepID=A0A4Q9GRL5_9MICO|nr:HtaA domain-containing protein [Glaciihabitans arcticus]TBN57602.1 hypothetical protein EYE40_09505 [Glaciihabitans arcticus]
MSTLSALSSRARTVVASLITALLVVGGISLAPTAAIAADAPTISVSKSTGLNPLGDTITVTGTGFLPSTDTNGARPPLAGKFSGAYVVFGKYPDNWKPSAGVSSSLRKNGATKWAVLAEDVETIGGAAGGAVTLNADGSFTAEITVAKGFTGEPATGNYGIYTYGGSGAVVPAFETFTPISFQAPPAVTVSKTSNISPAGETITVTGTGFVPGVSTSGTRPPLAGKFSGAYAVFGKYPDAWKPSAGVSSTLRKNGATKWAVPAEDLATIGGAGAGAVTLNADGSFTAELLVKPGFTGEPATGNYGIYTYGGSGATAPAFETFTPISFSAAPTIVVSKTTGLEALGETITVTGYNFLPDGTVSNGTRPPLLNTFSGAYAVYGKYPDAWKPSAGVSSALRKNGATKWAVPAADVETIGGAAGGAVTLNPDGSFTAEITVAKGFTGEPATGTYGIYTYGGSGAVVPAFETFTPIAFKAPPAVTVSKTSNISPAGETITVTGTGFVPGVNTTGTRPPLLNTFSGAYAVFAKYPDAWKPSAGVASSLRKNGSAKWAVLAEDVTPIGGAAAGAVILNPDGTFTAELTVKKGYANEPLIGNYGIYTYGGSGALAPAFETFTPISFSTAPTLGVSKTTGLNPEGETVTVTGYNFLPDGTVTNGTRPPLAGSFAGAYAVFAKYPENWKPSAGVASALRKNGSAKWAVPAESFDAVGGANAGAVTLDPDGSFTAEVLVKPGYTGEPAIGNYGIYSYGGSGATVAAFETYTPISFAAAVSTATTITVTPSTLVEGGTATLSAQVSPVAAGSVVFTSGASTLATVPTNLSGVATFDVAPLPVGDVSYTATFVPNSVLLFSGSADTEAVTIAPKTVGAGSLSWGIKQSFRDYVTGTIAKGSILTTGVTSTGGSFGFGQTTGGTWTELTGLGSSNYSGSVRFIGHNGLLDVSIANPTVRIESASSATLLVSVNGGQPIEFATMDLSAGIRSTPNNAVRYAEVPAVLTAAGAAVFAYNGQAFYPAGTAIDPLSFTIGTAGTTPVPPTAVTPKITLATSPASSVFVGKPVTLRASVAPTAAGIVYFRNGSTALGSAAVNASGLATLTLPSLAAGSYSFTAAFAPTDVERFTTASSSAIGFTVNKLVVSQPGSLTWGVKASLRDYVLGGGSIATSAGAGTSGGAFIFPQAGGTFDHATATGSAGYSGRVTFDYPAHKFSIGLSNPRVAITSASNGLLIADVTFNGSTTSGVTFANLRFGAANHTTVGATTTFSNVTASLTAAGAATFAGFYQAGDALDPMSFVIGKASSGFSGSSQDSEEEEWVAPLTPPATTGIESASSEYEVGATFTGRASGFQPNEEDIRVVLYSTPVILAEGIVADPAGVVRWSGTLPAGLEGEHTVTFQGSVSRGIPITITAPEVTTLEGCDVQDAAITWGFKESFRSYISGSIANGEWTVADGATYAVPNFGFADGTGIYNAGSGGGLVTFEGSIRFTGHDGLLDTTVSNPQFKLISASSAVLLLDISGETQDGATVDAAGVEFVTLDLAAATVTNENGIVTITDAPTELTTAGSDAFGTYDAGEPFDALTVSFSTPADCAVAAPAEPSTVEDGPITDDAPNLSWLLWLIVPFVLIGGIVVPMVVWRRRQLKQR